MSSDDKSPFLREVATRPPRAEAARYPAEFDGPFELATLAGAPALAAAPCGGGVAAVPRDAAIGEPIRYELEAAFEQLAPGSQITTAVGRDRAGSRDDVLRVQARLRQLGMTWVPDSGAIGAAVDDPTDHGIRLFRAMLEGEQLWIKGTRDSPCYASAPGRDRGIIEPGSSTERWLWSPSAPRWLTAIPPVRDGWCCNDRKTDGPGDLGCQSTIAESGMSSWLAEYLDQVGRAFRVKVQAFRPVIAALASQGLPALERLQHPALPRLGPLSAEEEDARRTAAIAQRVASDLVDLASAQKLEPAGTAEATLGTIDGGRALLIATYIAVPQGGCSNNHLGHQQGLEFDLRLFAHDGPRPGLTCDDARTSRLLVGLAIDCFLENPLTDTIIYNDKAIRDRVGAGLMMDKAGTHIHDNHVHVRIHGARPRVLVPAPPPGQPAVRISKPATVELVTSPPVDGDGEAEDPPCPDPGKFYAMADFIDLVRKVEAAYPQWTPVQVLGALRRVAGYDTRLFQIMYSTTDANPIKAGDGGLTAADLCGLEAMSSHQGGAVERGFVIDPTGKKVAVGHTLCGLAAGEHRNVSAGVVGTWLAAAVAQSLLGLSLDNLYATTIAGDLGQSAVLVHLGARPALIGALSDATDAELVGDIDGCVLASNGALGGRRVSEVLSRYYAPGPAAPGAVHSSARFRLFAPHLAGTTLKEQTGRFAKAYFFKADPRRFVSETADVEVSQVLIQFRQWYDLKLAGEAARQAGAQHEYAEPEADAPRPV